MQKTRLSTSAHMYISTRMDYLLFILCFWLSCMHAAAVDIHMYVDMSIIVYGWAFIVICGLHGTYDIAIQHMSAIYTIHVYVYSYIFMFLTI